MVWSYAPTVRSTFALKTTSGESVMPNEPVQCPNCGSGDVRSLAPESYRCEHCHTNFRWVDPTKSTVVQRPSVCRCGRVAVGFCCRCNAPCCSAHGGSTVDWKALSIAVQLAGFELQQDAISEGGETATVPASVREVLEEFGFPRAVICERCYGECVVSLRCALKIAGDSHSQDEVG